MRETIRLAESEFEASPEPEKPIVWEIFKNPEYRQWLRERMRSCIAEIIRTNANVIFFLDKSARPLAWLLKDMWPEGIDIPRIQFISVGYPDIVVDERTHRERRNRFLDDPKTRSPRLNRNLGSINRASHLIKIKPAVAYDLTVSGVSEPDPDFDLKENSLARDLRSAFGTMMHHGDKIILFDEYKFSSISVVYAADQMLKAFPGVVVEGMFFSVEGDTVPDSETTERKTPAKDALPIVWTKKPWMGIYEWPTGDKSFSLAANETNYEAVRAAAVDETEKDVRGMLVDSGKKFLEDFDAYSRYLESPDAQRGIGASRRQSIALELNRIRSKLQPLVTGSVPGPDDLLEYKNSIIPFLQSLPESSRFFWFSIGSLDLIPEYLGLRTRAGSRLDGTVLPPLEMKRLSDLLRRELQQVAKGL